ncbi:MAG: hypothetical protein MJZ20_06945 [Bacteroidaceae bacterium]|nr:hypothetical protein [Bacteroidaceae bacterium]
MWKLRRRETARQWLDKLTPGTKVWIIEQDLKDEDDAPDTKNIVLTSGIVTGFERDLVNTKLSACIDTALGPRYYSTKAWGKLMFLHEEDAAKVFATHNTYKTYRELVEYVAKLKELGPEEEVVCGS